MDGGRRGWREKEEIRLRQTVEAFVLVPVLPIALRFIFVGIKSLICPLQRLVSLMFVPLFFLKETLPGAKGQQFILDKKQRLIKISGSHPLSHQMKA